MASEINRIAADGLLEGVAGAYGRGGQSRSAGALRTENVDVVHVRQNENDQGMQADMRDVQDVVE